MHSIVLALMILGAGVGAGAPADIPCVVPSILPSLSDAMNKHPIGAPTDFEDAAHRAESCATHAPAPIVGRYLIVTIADLAKAIAARNRDGDSNHAGFDRQTALILARFLIHNRDTMRDVRALARAFECALAPNLPCNVVALSSRKSAWDRARLRSGGLGIGMPEVLSTARPSHSFLRPLAVRMRAMTFDLI